MTRDRRRDLIRALESFAASAPDAPPLEERPYYLRLIASREYRTHVGILAREGNSEAQELCARWRRERRARINAWVSERRRSDPAAKAKQREYERAHRRRTPPC